MGLSVMLITPSLTIIITTEKTVVITVSLLVMITATFKKTDVVRDNTVTTAFYFMKTMMSIMMIKMTLFVMITAVLCTIDDVINSGRVSFDFL
jgi:hypothetical protein